MKRSGILLAGLLAALAGAGEAQAQGYAMPSQENWKLQGAYRWWQPDLQGTLQKNGLELDGSEIDLPGDLGLDEGQSYQITGALQFKPGVKLRGSYTKLSLDGDVAVDRLLRYEDVTFFRGTQLVSTIRGAFWTGDLEFDFSKGGWGYAGVLLGARYLDVDYVTVAPATSKRIQEQLQTVVPTIGLALRYYAGRISLSGEGAGMSIGKNGTAWELDGSARLHLSDRLSVMGGYRLYSVKTEKDVDLFELRESGFYFGAEISL